MRQETTRNNDLVMDGVLLVHQSIRRNQCGGNNAKEATSIVTPNKAERSNLAFRQVTVLSKPNIEQRHQSQSN